MRVAVQLAVEFHRGMVVSWANDGLEMPVMHSNCCHLRRTCSFSPARNIATPQGPTQQQPDGCRPAAATQAARAFVCRVGQVHHSSRATIQMSPGLAKVVCALQAWICGTQGLGINSVTQNPTLCDAGVRLLLRMHTSWAPTASGR